MKRRMLVILLLLLACLLPLRAQQMSVESFSRLRRPLWKRSAVTVDKSCALLDLMTDEKGFAFFTRGNQPAEAEEGEGVVTVKLPNKSAYLIIRHPEYGQLMWRVPGGKRLKKGKHYQAYLFAGDPTKEFKAPKQWVVFHLDPPDVVLQIDSLTRPVRQETVEYLLPVGEHRYRVEAPFYEPVENSFTLTDSVRKVIPLSLQPFYSFLTVKTSWQGGDLFVDNARIRKEDATSYRLAEGYHRVSIFWADQCFYDSLLYVGKAQKKVLDLKVSDLAPRARRKDMPMKVDPPEDKAENAAPGASVRLLAADSLAQIWLDREPVGTGSWEGTLAPGYHLAQTVSGGRESAPTVLWIEDGIPQEVELGAPGTGYGLVNIHCNVAGANITIDGKDFGQTPQIIRLDASRNYRLVLSRKGWKDASCLITPRGNHLVEVELKMKKGKI